MPDLVPCAPWITGADLECDGTAPDKTIAAQIASDTLFVLSGSQFTGECERISRPGTAPECWLPWGFYSGMWVDNPRWSAHVWEHWGWKVLLGWDEVVSIQTVTVDGVVLDPAAYRVEDRAWLARDDHVPWPVTDTWEVELTAGLVVPALGVAAAKVLACEVMHLLPGGEPDDCALPENTRSFVRLGLSAQLVDPAETAADQSTGLTLVDVFLDTVNPDRLSGNPIVSIPGAPPHSWHRTWP